MSSPADLLAGQTFPLILADPNWAYQNFGQAKHGAARSHYAGSAPGQMAAIPVGRWARRDSTLLLWATLPKLDQAIALLDAWGFSLVTSVPWIKTAPASADLAKGVGFWWHGAAELLLVARRGKAAAPKVKKHERPDGLLVGEPGAISFWARRGPHSRKPLALFEWAEAYLPGPRLELYARGGRPGWTCVGHEATTRAHLCEHGAISMKDAASLGLLPEGVAS